MWRFLLYRMSFLADGGVAKLWFVGDMSFLV